MDEFWFLVTAGFLMWISGIGIGIMYEQSVASCPACVQGECSVEFHECPPQNVTIINHYEGSSCGEDLEVNITWEDSSICDDPKYECLGEVKPR